MDLESRILPCGVLDSATRKIEGFASQSYYSSERIFYTTLETSNHAIPSLDFDYESLPLLMEPGGSHKSIDTYTQGRIP